MLNGGNEIPSNGRTNSPVIINNINNANSNMNNDDCKVKLEYPMGSTPHGLNNLGRGNSSGNNVMPIGGNSSVLGDGVGIGISGYSSVARHLNETSLRNGGNNNEGVNGNGNNLHYLQTSCKQDVRAGLVESDLKFGGNNSVGHMPNPCGDIQSHQLLQVHHPCYRQQFQESSSGEEGSSNGTASSSTSSSYPEQLDLKPDLDGKEMSQQRSFKSEVELCR